MMFSADPAVRTTPLPEKTVGRGSAEAPRSLPARIDVTGTRQISDPGEQARRCRRLASSATDRKVIDTLLLMAGEYEREARSLGDA